MADVGLQDFTTYTVADDTASDLTVISNRVTCIVNSNSSLCCRSRYS